MGERQASRKQTSPIQTTARQDILTYHLPKDSGTWTRPQSPTFPSFLIIGPFGISLKAFPTLPTPSFGVLKGDP